MRFTFRRMLLGLLLATTAGCNDGAPLPKKPADKPKRTTPPAASKKTKSPDTPVNVSEDELVSKLIITDTTVADRYRNASYRRDPTVPAGAVLGLCYVPFDKHVTVPLRTYVAVEGANAVRDPLSGEAAHYKIHMPWEPVLLGAYDGKWKRYGIERSVIIIRDVKNGSRPPLERPAFVVDYQTGQLQIPQDGHNYGAGNVTFVPLNERVQFSNTEFYPCDLAVTHVPTNQVAFRVELEGYSDPRSPGRRYGSAFNMTPPKLIQSPPITKPGMYRITSERHPWLNAYLFAVENPYVAVSGPDGVFRIDGLPEGKYPVDVWHVRFEAEKQSREIQIFSHRTEELLARFKVPKLLSDPPPLPATPIQRWAVVGPFEWGRKSYPPEEKLNFTGEYRTAYPYAKVQQPLRWRTGDGQLRNYYATAYFYTELHASRAGKVRFGFGAFSHRRGWQGVYTYRVWVNDEQIYSYRGDWHGRNAAIVPYELKAGKNGLLVRLDTSRYNHWARVVVTYEAEGVTARLPEPLRSTKGQ